MILANGSKLPAGVSGFRKQSIQRAHACQGLLCGLFLGSVQMCYLMK